MKRTNVREEVRKMRFEEAYEGWNQGRLSQKAAGMAAARNPSSDGQEDFRQFLSMFAAVRV